MMSGKTQESHGEVKAKAKRARRRKGLTCDETGTFSATRGAKSSGAQSAREDPASGGDLHAGRLYKIDAILRKSELCYYAQP